MLNLFIFLLINLPAVKLNIKIDSWKRNIDLTTNVIKVNNDVTITNIGSDSVMNFDLFIPQNESINLFEMSAKINNEQASVLPIELGKSLVHFSDRPYTVHRLSFLEAINPNTQVNIIITQVFHGLLLPLPEYIQQNKPQLFIFYTETFIKTTYSIVQQTLTFLLNTNTLKRHSTEYKPTVLSNKVSYDLTKDANELINGETVDLSHRTFVHFQSQANCIVIEKMVRNIEVSSWGFIYVEDHYDLIHTGAKLTGEFSRLAYTTSPDPNAANMFEIELPANANKIYYKDVIGNISTSSYQKIRSKTILNIIPRFPLLGGWNVQFFIGYYLPSKSYVSIGTDGSIKRLKIPLVDKFSQDFVLRNLDMNVVLPEHTSRIKLTSKNKKLVNVTTGSKHFAYLDVFGRPVLKFQASNLIDTHAVNFEVIYHLNDLTLWMKPILLFLYFFGLNLVLMLVYKIDFNFKKTNSDFVDKILDYANKIKNLVKDFKSKIKDIELQLDTFKKQKDTIKFNEYVKQFHKESQSIVDSFKTINPSINKDAPEFSKNLTEIIQLIDSRIDLINKNIEITLKLVSSKVTRKEFIDSYDEIVSKQNIIDNKLPSLLDCFN